MLELAYIDAGSGSLIVQAVIAAIVAVPLFFRQQIGRILRSVRGERPESTDEQNVSMDDRAREG